MHTRTRDSLQPALGVIRDALGLAQELSCDRIVQFAVILALFGAARSTGDDEGASVAELADGVGTSLEVTRHAVRSLRMHGIAIVSHRSARTEFFKLSDGTFKRVSAWLEQWAKAMGQTEALSDTADSKRLQPPVRLKS